MHEEPSHTPPRRTPGERIQLNPAQAARLADELLNLDTEGPDSEFDELVGVPATTADEPADRMGRFRIARLVAAGGMGEVYEAEQDNPRRRVALKVVRGNARSPELRRRFEHEVRILASLQHPGIAQIFEAGELDTGAPYFAMEFIEGEPLTAYATGRKLSLRDRLQLFLRVCQAVEHAHQKGVIHRDLKPANILVTPPSSPATSSGSGTEDTIGHPKVLDFGVARATDADVTLASLQTEIGRLVGTLQYMSPEQADADPDDLDTRSDVYALGVVLYELLSGKLPYEVTGEAGARVANALHVIKEVDPAPLSSIDRLFRGDLETIVSKALEKDRERRYQSVGELAGDIRRYLDDQPIVARRASAWYELKKFARRNRGIVGSAAVMVASLLTCLALAIAFGLREARNAEQLDAARSAAEAAATSALRQERLARESAKSAEEVIGFVTNAISSVEPGKGGPRLTLIDLLDATAAELASRPPTDPVTSAAIEATIGSMYLSLQQNSAAIEFLSSSLHAQESLLGPDSPATLTTLHRLCKAFRNEDRVDEARRLAHLMIERGSRAYGDPSPYVLAARNILVHCLQEEQDFASARAEAQRLLEQAISLFGEDSSIAGTILHTCAQLAQQVGDVKESAHLWQRYLDQQANSPSPEWRTTIVAKAQLAQALAAMGKVREAEPLFLEALDAQRQEQGPGHPDTLFTQIGFATLLAQTRRFDEAIPLLREAVDSLRDTRGPLHDQTLTAMGVLGDALAGASRFDEAEPMLRQSLDGFARIKPGTHRDVQVTMANLADVLSRIGNHVEAEDLARQVVAANEASRGPTHLLTLKAKNNLAVVFSRAKKHADAEHAYQEVLAALLSLPDPPGPGIVATYMNLGTCQLRQRKFEAGEVSLKNAYTEAVRVYPENHPTPKTAAQELSSLYAAWGRDADAMEWARRGGLETPPPLEE